MSRVDGDVEEGEEGEVQFSIVTWDKRGGGEREDKGAKEMPGVGRTEASELGETGYRGTTALQKGQASSRHGSPLCCTSESPSLSLSFMFSAHKAHSWRVSLESGVCGHLGVYGSRRPQSGAGYKAVTSRLHPCFPDPSTAAVAASPATGPEQERWSVLRAGSRAR